MWIAVAVTKDRCVIPVMDSDDCMYLWKTQAEALQSPALVAVSKDCEVRFFEVDLRKRKR
jgi:hypothetical protein